MKLVLHCILIISVLGLAGCHLPIQQSVETQAPQSVFTEAALTVAAELTKVVPVVTNTPLPPTETATLTPTNTVAVTPTNTPIPCNLGTWNPATIDVTIPDNQVMAPNQIFSKTWRIKNAGSCSWNSNYLLVFDHGDTLGVSSGYTQQLTSGTVNPGQEVDLTVNNLKAPSTPGTYTGYWRLRDPGGTLFGITPSGGTFVVKIVVVASTTKTLNPLDPGVESGTIRADAGPFADFTAGESNADPTKNCEFFLSFDISSIPTNATITEVKLDLTTYSIEGNPFSSLGVLNAYIVNYGDTLEPADFVSGMPPGNIADWGSTGALGILEASPELRTYLQSKLGTARLQLRFQFGTANGLPKDRLTIGDGTTNPHLIVTYTTP